MFAGKPLTQVVRLNPGEKFPCQTLLAHASSDVAEISFEGKANPYFIIKAIKPLVVVFSKSVVYQIRENINE